MALKDIIKPLQRSFFHKISGDKTNHAQSLRLIAIIVSFAFIPVFLFGVVSVWSVVFAVIGALYLKKNLQEIVDTGRVKYNDEPKERARYSLIQYLCLVAKFIAIYSIPQCLLLSALLTGIIDGPRAENLGIDGAVGVFDFALFITQTKSSLAELQAPQLLMFATLVASIVLFFAVITICFKPLYRIFDWQFWGTVHYTPQRTGVEFPPKKQKELIKAYGRCRVFYEIVELVSSMSLIILVVLFAFISSKSLVFNVFASMTYIFLSVFLTLLATCLIFIALIALTRMSGKICDTPLVESLKIHKENHQQILNNGEGK